jgi:hypothetical protein
LKEKAMNEDQADLLPPRVVTVVQPEQAPRRSDIAWQHEYPGEFFLCIDDCHLWPSNRRLRGRRRSWSVVHDYVAQGLDATKATVFLLSDVPEVFELLGLLTKLAPERTRMAFQAASFLLLRPTLVVGHPGNHQAVDLARRAAMRFNGGLAHPAFPLVRLPGTSRLTITGPPDPLQGMRVLQRDAMRLEAMLHSGARRARTEAITTVELAWEGLGQGFSRKAIARAADL